MKVCLAVLCGALALVHVHTAPAADVRANELVERLRQLLHQRNTNDTNSEGAVDMENDDQAINAINMTVVGRMITRRGPGLTQDQKNRAVAYHNKLRKGEGASNMETLRWSDRLAQLAQDWADRCAWGHRPHSSYNAKDYGFSSIGENIWAWSVGGKKKIPEDPIQMWFDEKQYYVYETQQCRKQPCGHYTTVTWAETTHVGCGFAQCGYLQNVGYRNGVYMVCNYGPWGGGHQPFKKGQACTKCDRGQFLCTDGMCDSSCNSAGGGNRCACKAKCKCGRKTSDCKCECQKGYTGPACTEACEDKSRQCGANPGWPQSWCHNKHVFGGMMYDTVNKQCPKMCGHCEAGNEPCHSSREIDDDAAKLDNAELEFLIGALQKND